MVGGTPTHQRLIEVLELIQFDLVASIDEGTWGGEKLFVVLETVSCYNTLEVGVQCVTLYISSWKLITFDSGGRGTKGGLQLNYS